MKKYIRMIFVDILLMKVKNTRQLMEDGQQKDTITIQQLIYQLREYLQFLD